MGCGSSTDTVQPFRTEGDEETGSKCGGRGDSAVSKVTADSGVVMDNREVLLLPGVLPRKPPPQTFACVGHVPPDGLPQQESVTQERPKSSEILEELLSQGIIPVGPTQGTGRTGEAYNIMKTLNGSWKLRGITRVPLADVEEGARRRRERPSAPDVALHSQVAVITLADTEGIRRGPPARLESLKVPKSLPSREEIEEKMRLAEERRQLKENEMKTRLRAKSARVRRPAVTSEEDEKNVTPVELLTSPLTPVLTPPFSQGQREAAEGGEWVREAGGDGREREVGHPRGGMDVGGASGGEGGEDSEEEDESTQVETLNTSQLLAASGKVESDMEEIV